MNDGMVKDLREALEAPLVIKLTDGRERLLRPNHWQDATPEPPSPRAVGVHTLQAIADYLSANIDGLSKKALALHVVDPSTVRLLGTLDPATKDRFCFLEAIGPPTALTFGGFIPQDMFVLKLQTCFVQSPERDQLLALVGAIAEKAVRDSADDGVSQEVVTRKGVSVVERTKVPNPVHLAPFRTFPEIVQPTSAFILRVRSGEDQPQLGLFEADGGHWKQGAIEQIAAWLDEHVDGVAVLG